MPSATLCPDCTCGRHEADPPLHAPECPVRQEWDAEQQRTAEDDDDE